MLEVLKVDPLKVDPLKLQASKFRVWRRNSNHNPRKSEESCSRRILP